MNALQAYATQISSAMDILAEAHGMPERDLIELGLPDVEARELSAWRRFISAPLPLAASSALPPQARATTIW